MLVAADYRSHVRLEAIIHREVAKRTFTVSISGEDPPIGDVSTHIELRNAIDQVEYG